MELQKLLKHSPTTIQNEMEVVDLNVFVGNFTLSNFSGIQAGKIA